MTIFFSQRLTSNTSTVFLGTNMTEAAFNAANGTGNHPEAVARHVNPSPTWPSLQKFENDDSSEAFSPFGDVPNPQYIWDQPTSDGQTVAFAIASEQFTVPVGVTASFSMFLGAFADNAMEVKMELFEQIGSSFMRVSPQPDGLDEFLLVAGNPNNPAVGLTINGPPYTFQDIRMYSTRFETPAVVPPTQESRIFKIVVSFEVTNYLVQPQFASNPSSLNNPAGLQFMVDIYAVGPRFLYVADGGDNTVDIYNITNPTAPVRVGQFNGGNLSSPQGLAITGTTLYVGNLFDDTIEIYNITNPTAPVRVGQFNGGNIDDPRGLAITGTTLYVASSGGVGNTVDIYNITNPTAPVHVGEFNGGNLSSPQGLAITGNILYVSNFFGANVEIYDITNPTAPIHVGEFNGGNLNGPWGLAITGTTLYVANQFDNTIEIYNIINPAAPVRVGQFNGGNLNGPQYLAITGTTLYVANAGNDRVEIYNITNLTAPVLVGQFTGVDPRGLATLTLVG